MIWIALIVASGIGFSYVFACAAPFAAFATLAALKFERREAFAILVLLWLVNQAIGYGVLGYPRSWDSLAWGCAIGLSGLLALLAAMALALQRPGGFAVSLPFIGAFAAYEMGLYLGGFLLPDGEGAFATAVVERVFMINLIALIGLLLVHRLALAAGWPPRGDGSLRMADVPR